MKAKALDLEKKMATLARSFPCMAKAPGAKLWDSNAFDHWAYDAPISRCELVTVRFLLAVWDRDFNWKCSRFDLMDAMSIWDEQHRAAFLAWARDP